MKKKIRRQSKRSKKSNQPAPPPSMEQRGEQVRALAVTVDDTWPGGGLHIVANDRVVIAAFKAFTPAQAHQMLDAVKRFQLSLM